MWGTIRTSHISFGFWKEGSANTLATVSSSKSKYIKYLFLFSGPTKILDWKGVGLHVNNVFLVWSVELQLIGRYQDEKEFWWNRRARHQTFGFKSFERFITTLLKCHQGKITCTSVKHSQDTFNVCWHIWKKYLYKDCQGQTILKTFDSNVKWITNGTESHYILYLYLSVWC